MNFHRDEGCQSSLQDMRVSRYSGCRYPSRNFLRRLSSLPYHRYPSAPGAWVRADRQAPPKHIVFRTLLYVQRADLARFSQLAFSGVYPTASFVTRIVSTPNPITAKSLLSRAPLLWQTFVAWPRFLVRLHPCNCYSHRDQHKVIHYS